MDSLHSIAVDGGKGSWAGLTNDYEVESPRVQVRVLCNIFGQWLCCTEAPGSQEIWLVVRKVGSRP